MEGDEFDDDDELMRRTELIETQSHGTLHARMVGDGEDPLILYLHSSKDRCSSLDFNGLVLGMAEAMRANRHKRLNAERDEADHLRILSMVRLEGKPLSTLLKDTELHTLASHLGVRTYEAGDVVIEEGSWGEEFYMIKTGAHSPPGQTCRPPAA